MIAGFGEHSREGAEPVAITGLCTNPKFHPLPTITLGNVNV